jgi:hypothetical protein
MFGFLDIEWLVLNQGCHASDQHDYVSKEIFDQTKAFITNTAALDYFDNSKETC